MKLILVTAFLAVLCSPALVRAGTIQAVVLEINDGKTITVENLHRPVKVVLRGVEPPEADQPYGEVARQHLTDLILGKQVTIQ